MPNLTNCFHLSEPSPSTVCHPFSRHCSLGTRGRGWSGSSVITQKEKETQKEKGQNDINTRIIWDWPLVYFFLDDFLRLHYSSDLIGMRSDSEFVSEKRDLAIEFIFCLLLIEVLKQLSVHPGHEDLVHHIEDIAFKHFRYRDT